MSSTLEDYVEDDNGRKLPFYVTPAKEPERSPILVCFHGHSVVFKSPNFPGIEQNYTVIYPHDRFGWNRMGSWWLGEHGDFFVIGLLDKMLSRVRESYRSKGDLFVYGTSMGGFGALVHGARWGAKAICANVPQTQLVYGSYATHHKELTVDHVFAGNTDVLWADAARVIEHYKDNVGLIMLVQNRYDHPGSSYTTDQTFHLANKLLELNLNFHLVIQPETGHKIIWTVADAVSLFAKYRQHIYPETLPPQ